MKAGAVFFGGGMHCLYGMAYEHPVSTPCINFWIEWRKEKGERGGAYDDNMRVLFFLCLMSLRGDLH